MRIALAAAFLVLTLVAVIGWSLPRLSTPISEPVNSGAASNTNTPQASAPATVIVFPAPPRDSIVALTVGQEPYVIVVDQRAALKGAVRIALPIVGGSSVAVAPDVDRIVVLDPASSTRVRQFAASTGGLVNSVDIGARGGTKAVILAVLPDATRAATARLAENVWSFDVVDLASGSRLARAELGTCERPSAVFRADGASATAGCLGRPGLSTVDIATGRVTPVRLDEDLAGLAQAAEGVFAVGVSGRVWSLQGVPLAVGQVPLDGVSLTLGAVSVAGDRIAIGFHPTNSAPDVVAGARVFDARKGTLLPGPQHVFYNTGGGLVPTPSTGGILLDSDPKTRPSDQLFGVRQDGVLLGDFLFVGGFDGQRVRSVVGLVDAAGTVTRDAAIRIADLSLEGAQRDRVEALAAPTAEVVRAFPVLERMIQTGTRSSVLWVVAEEGLIAYKGVKYVWLIMVIDPVYDRVVGSVGGQSGPRPSSFDALPR